MCPRRTPEPVVPRDPSIVEGALEEGALDIVRRLSESGFRALWAGGCVRDRLLSLPPKDYDVATDADPDEVMRLFAGADARFAGTSFGVVRVTIGGYAYEVARFRKEGAYTDGRRPDSVMFTDEREDAQRRDFTVNGMFYDPLAGRVIDYVDGQADLVRRQIRAIGDPDARFEEDRLRLLRAVRFAGRLNWPIEGETWSALRRLAPSVESVSAERIRDELLLSLTEGVPPWAIRLLLDGGLLDVVLPEVAAMVGVPQPPAFHPEGDVFTHTMMMLGIAHHPSPDFALGLLLHDVGKPPTYRVADRIRFNDHTRVGKALADRVCRRLRLSIASTEHVTRLVVDHHRFTHVKEMRPRTLKRLLRTPRFEDHLELHRIDCLASHGNLGNYAFTVAAREACEPDDLRPKPLIGGDDLIALGYMPGPDFGPVLTAIEDEQLDGSLKGRDDALALAVKLMDARGISRA